MLLTAQSSLPLPSPIPLVLDLDGTVIRTDTFHEMMACLLLQKPLILLCLPFWFLKGRAYAKAQLLEYANLNVETLPYNKHVLSFARKAAGEGRSLILATGTDQRLAQKISDHLGIFQEVIGSDGMINMTGHQKGQALTDRFGVHGFDYAGDSPIDASVWQLSRKALVVCPKWGVLKKAQALKDGEHLQFFPREKGRFYAIVLALRPLFWIFSPLSTSLFIGFSLLSSGLFIMGDLLTLEKERKETHKPMSVFAGGYLHLVTAFILAPLLILSSLFFLRSLPGIGFYICLYIPLFLALDRLTRFSPQPRRWILLGLFQILATLLMEFRSGIPFLPL